MANAQLNNLRQRIKELSQAKVRVGWFSDVVYPDTGEPVGRIAAQNEFGSFMAQTGVNYTSIPARPFLRPAGQHAQEWFESIIPILNLYLRGNASKDDVLENLGAVAEMEIIQNIHSTYKPVNSPLTLMLRQLRKAGLISRPYSWRDIKLARKYLAQGRLVLENEKPLEDTGFMVESIEHRIVE